MDADRVALADDIETLKSAVLEARAAAASAQLKLAAAHADVSVARAELAGARAEASDDQARIAALKLEIAALKRLIHGPRSERSARLIDQMELELEELEASATEDELAAERAAAKTTQVAAFTRKRPSKKPFPEHLPRERVVHPGMH